MAGGSKIRLSDPLSVPSAYRIAGAVADDTEKDATLASIPAITNEHLKRLAQASAQAQELDVLTDANAEIMEFSQWANDNRDEVENLLPEYDRRVGGYYAQLSGLDMNAAPLAVAKLGRQLSAGRAQVMDLQNERASDRIKSKLATHGATLITGAIAGDQPVDHWLRDYMSEANQAYSDGYLTQWEINEYKKKGLSAYYSGRASLLASESRFDEAKSLLREGRAITNMSPEKMLSLTAGINSAQHNQELNTIQSMVQVGMTTRDMKILKDALWRIDALPPGVASSYSLFLQDQVYKMADATLGARFGQALNSEFPVRDVEAAWTNHGKDAPEGYVTPKNEEDYRTALSKAEKLQRSDLRVQRNRDSGKALDKLTAMALDAAKRFYDPSNTEHVRQLSAAYEAIANEPIYQALNLSDKNTIDFRLNKATTAYSLNEQAEFYESMESVIHVLSMGPYSKITEGSVLTQIAALSEFLDNKDKTGSWDPKRLAQAKVQLEKARSAFTPNVPAGMDPNSPEYQQMWDAANSGEMTDLTALMDAHYNHKVSQHSIDSPRERGQNVDQAHTAFTEIRRLSGMDPEEISQTEANYIRLIARAFPIETLYASGNYPAIHQKIMGRVARGDLSEEQGISLLKEFASSLKMTQTQMDNANKWMDASTFGPGQRTALNSSDPTNAGAFDYGLEVEFRRIYGDTGTPEDHENFTIAFAKETGYISSGLATEIAKLWDSKIRDDHDKALKFFASFPNRENRRLVAEHLGTHLNGPHGLEILQQAIEFRSNLANRPSVAQARMLAEYKVLKRNLEPGQSLPERLQDLEETESDWGLHLPIMDPLTGKPRLDEDGMPISDSSRPIKFDDRGRVVLKESRQKQIHDWTQEHLLGAKNLFSNTEIYEGLEEWANNEGIDFDTTYKPLLDYWSENYRVVGDRKSLSPSFMDFDADWRDAVRKGWTLKGTPEGAIGYAVDAVFKRGGWGVEFDALGGGPRRFPFSRLPAIKGVSPEKWALESWVTWQRDELYNFHQASMVLMNVSFENGSPVFPANFNGKGILEAGWDRFKDGVGHTVGLGFWSDPTAIYQAGHGFIQEASDRADLYAAGNTTQGWSPEIASHIESLGKKLLGLQNPQMLQMYMSVAGLFPDKNLAQNPDGTTKEFETRAELQKYLGENLGATEAPHIPTEAPKWKSDLMPYGFGGDRTPGTYLAFDPAKMFPMKVPGLEFQETVGNTKTMEFIALQQPFANTHGLRATGSDTENVWNISAWENSSSSFQAIYAFGDLGRTTNKVQFSPLDEDNSYSALNTRSVKNATIATRRAKLTNDIMLQNRGFSIRNPSVTITQRMAALDSTERESLAKDPGSIDALALELVKHISPRYQGMGGTIARLDDEGEDVYGYQRVRGQMYDALGVDMPEPSPGFPLVSNRTLRAILSDPMRQLIHNLRSAAARPVDE